MNKKNFFKVYEVNLGQLEKKYVNKCLDTSWIGQGEFVKKFENKFSKFLNCKYGVTTTSGTTALHIACKVAGIKKGDEVIVSSSTNMATAFSIIYCGATPIPIDIDPETWQMDVRLIEKKITKKTVAIMPVHLFGQPVDMDPIKKISKKYKLKIIEDCAEAHGVKYKNKVLGSFSDLSAFSFFSNKSITCGEGGMVCTNNFKYFVKANSMKNLFYGKKNRFMHDGIGYNYRLPNISAAIGLGQLENFKKIVIEKDRIYKRYKENLENTKYFKIPKIRDFTTKFVMWVFNMELDNKHCNIDLNTLQNRLYKKGIETRPAFVPINEQKALIKIFPKQIIKNSCPNASKLMKRGFYLPSGNNLKNREIDYICEKLISSCR
jgi:perosamine synthetase